MLMISRSGIVASLVLLIFLLVGCTLSPEQIQTLQQQASLMATEVAAKEAKAMASSGEAPTLQPGADLTPPSAAPGPTRVVTATMTLVSTRETPVLSTAMLAPGTTEPVVVAPTAAVTAPLPALTLTPTLTFVLPTPAAATPPSSPTPSPTATPTFTPSPTATPTSTTSPTAIPTPTPTAISRPAPSPPTPQPPPVFVTPRSSTVDTPTATPTSTPAVQLVVLGNRVNIRQGPSMEYDIIGQALKDQQLPVYASNPGQSWWLVCCTDDGRRGWISNSVVSASGDLAAVPVVSPLLPDDLQATWAIHWECHAQGCLQPACAGQSRAEALQVRTERWLDVRREVVWQDQCGPSESWLTPVDRYLGIEERTPANPPLFYVWEGSNPGPETGIMEVAGRRLSVWCTETRTREVPQQEGWTVVFQGHACYDRVSGILVSLRYSKQWLFTGTFNGQAYEHHYFGDFETYEQVLTSTNVPLAEEGHR